MGDRLGMELGNLQREAAGREFQLYLGLERRWDSDINVLPVDTPPNEQHPPGPDGGNDLGK